ncbi:hypothetical protein DDD63_10575 [Actinobaculum sp. 313]|nr:hypothetical protein DDD63_10575 [Actinobaculum sp. 313]
MTTEMDYSAPFLQGDDYGATEDFSGTILNATAENYTLTSENSRGIETIPAKDGGEAIEGLSFDVVYEHSELGTLNSWMWMRVFTDPQAPRAVYVILQCQQDSYSEDIRNQIRDDGHLTLTGGQPATFDRRMPWVPTCGPTPTASAKALRMSAESGCATRFPTL